MEDWIIFNDDGSTYANLADLAGFVFRKIWVIIIATALIGFASYGYSRFCITPQYQASIKMYILNFEDEEYTQGISLSDLNASELLVDTIAIILTSNPVIEAVIDEVGLEYTKQQLVGMISISSINETEICRVTITSSDPIEAEKIANAIATVAPKEIMDVVVGSTVKIVEYAEIPTIKSAPNNKRNMVKGMLLGFVGSSALLVLTYVFRSGLSAEGKLERDFKEFPVLASIPEMGDRKKHSNRENGLLCDKLNFSAAEAYKLLRTNITYSFSDDKSFRILGVTSSLRNEGKTTTSINLAFTLSLAEKKVCLIDCDMRLPATAVKLNVNGQPGLSDLLTGQTNIKSIYRIYNSGKTKFGLITAGSIPPNPSELLGSNRMKVLLENLGKQFDYIILDLPPVSIVSDALTLSDSIDGMLYVVREDLYDRRLLKKSLDTLKAVNTKVIGTVVTYSKVQQKQYSHYGNKYGYEYGYGYGQSSASQNQNSVKKAKKENV